MMPRVSLAYRAPLTLALLVLCMLRLASDPVFAKTRDDDAVIFIGEFSDVNGPSDDGMESNGTSMSLWRRGDTLLGGVDLVASGTADTAVIFNGHYHAATSKLDFLVQFPRDSGATNLDDYNIELRSIPPAVLVVEYHLTLRHHAVIGTAKEIYDATRQNDQTSGAHAEEIRLPEQDPSSFSFGPHTPRLSQTEWFELAWCEFTNRDYRILFYNFLDQQYLCYYP